MKTSHRFGFALTEQAGVRAMRSVLATLAVTVGLICTTLAIPSLPAQEDANADDAYLRAYMLKKQAEQLIDGGKLDTAYGTLSNASQAYDSIAARWPNWEPELITYRRRQIDQDLANLGVRMKDAGLAVASGSRGARPVSPPPATAPFNPVAPATPAPAGNRTASGTGYLAEAQRAYEAELQRSRSETAAAHRATEQIHEKFRSVMDEVAFAKNAAEKLRQQKATAETRATQLEATIAETAKTNAAKAEKSRAELESARAEIAELNSQQERTLAELEKAGARSAALHKRLDESARVVADLQSERNELVKQRDEMEALLGSKGGTSETETKLLEENRRLRSRLADSLKEVANLKKDQRGKDEEIATLKGTVRDLRSQNAALLEENEAYQARIEDLSNRLLEASNDITATGGTVSDPILLEENRILRGVIHRQIKKLGARKHKARLLAEQLHQSSLKDKELISEVEELVGERILITSEEQALFKADFGEKVDATFVASSERAAYEKEIAHLAPPELLKQASSHYAEGDFERTEVLFDRYLITGDEAKSGAIHANLGVVQMRLEKFDKSEENLKVALRKAPEDSFPHFNLGFNYLWRDRAEDALVNLESSAQLDPNNPKARFYLGVACARSEDYSRAKIEFEEAIALEPKYGVAHFNLSILHLLNGKNGMEKAREHYRKALECGVEADKSLEERLGLLSAGR